MFLTRASGSSTDPLKSWEYYDLYTDFMTLQMSFQKKSVSHSPFSWLHISVGGGQCPLSWMIKPPCYIKKHD